MCAGLGPVHMRAQKAGPGVSKVPLRLVSKFTHTGEYPHCSRPLLLRSLTNLYLANKGQKHHVVSSFFIKHLHTLHIFPLPSPQITTTIHKTNLYLKLIPTYILHYIYPAQLLKLIEFPLNSNENTSTLLKMLIM